MTSFKKPLIAIATVVALATTGFIVSPANAAITATATGSVSGSGTSSSPYILNVPADNAVDTEALAIVVTVTANTTVTATATGAKLLTAVDTVTTDVNSGTGSATFSANSGTGTSVTLYVYTTSTTAGSVVVTVGGDSTTYVVKGAAGAAYSLATTTPSLAGLGVAVPFTATVSDVFGNAVENATITSTVLRGSVSTVLTWDAVDKRYEGVITTPTTASAVNGISTISSTDVSGLAKAVKEVSFSIAVADLASQVTTLQAELATAKAELATATASLALEVAKATGNKNKYNALAKKWNKKFPKAKVTLIK